MMSERFSILFPLGLEGGSPWLEPKTGLDGFTGETSAPDSGAGGLWCLAHQWLSRFIPIPPARQEKLCHR
jgi:hypothetical protein